MPGSRSLGDFAPRSPFDVAQGDPEPVEGSGRRRAAYLGAEHQTLKRQVAELQREHEALERKSGFDRREHAEHRRRLQRKLTELRAHLARLKAGGGGPRR
ncbi:MAG: hypothetical protein DMF85_03160 [Acidobacteria bacterium]|nr:MAG: hypothetical protein DMF85_03160 [Acidobacteriota bacterium]